MHRMWLRPVSVPGLQQQELIAATCRRGKNGIDEMGFRGRAVSDSEAKFDISTHA
jgi:hypothetical protein